MSQIVITLTNAQGQVQEIQHQSQPGQKPVRVQVQAGTQVAITVDGKPLSGQSSGKAQLKKVGKDLVIELEGQAIAEAGDFFVAQGASLEGGDWSFAPDQGLVANGAAVTVTPEALAAEVAAVGLSGTGQSGALLLGAGGLAVLAAAGQSALANIVSGVFVAGPVVSGHNLVVKIYNPTTKALLGQGQVDSKGQFSIDVGSYTGPVVVQVQGQGGTPDYRDEATGLDVDLSADLLAIGQVNGPTTLNINPLTTKAAGLPGRLGGLSR